MKPHAVSSLPDAPVRPRTSLSAGRFFAALAFSFASVAPVSAALIGSRSIELGGGIGESSVSGTDTDLTSYFGRGNLPIGKFLIFEADTRLDYQEWNDDGGSRDMKWSTGNLNLLLSGTLPGFKPFAAIGGSYVESDSGRTSTSGNDSGWGYNVGVGVDITLIPIVTLTPYVGYTQAGDIEKVTYSLDASVWFTLFGVGINVGQQDWKDTDVKMTYATLYGAIRF